MRDFRLYRVAFLEHRHYQCQTYRDKAAGAVRGTDGKRRVAHELSDGVGRDEVAEHHDESQDEFHTKAFPGGQCSAVRDGGLQIALVAGYGDAAKEREREKEWGRAR